MADYLIVGGGLAGCALASRLKQYDQSATVTLLEAGPDKHDDPAITEPLGAFSLVLSDYCYNYKTVPQKHLGGAQIHNNTGAVLSGSSAVNYASWTRGAREDYDSWAAAVDDKKWSYDALLPYFKMTETHHEPRNVDDEQHGFDGPIHTTSQSRIYPLCDEMRSMFHEATKLPFIKDANGGEPLGIAPMTENWCRGKRNAAGIAYGLEGVDVRTNAKVRKIIMNNNVAIGVELIDGNKVLAHREVIVCCGAYRTPQLLMLSGIGPREELNKHGIQPVVDSPNVGRRLHDHHATVLYFKLKHPEKDLAVGSPNFLNNPGFTEGLPSDILVTASADTAALKDALKADNGGASVSDSHPLLQNRGHLEFIPVYAPISSHCDMPLPFDGSIMSIAILNFLPSARGAVTISSADSVSDPVIDPNYYGTEADRVILRSGVRTAFRAVETEIGRSVIAEEVTPPGYPKLSSKSSDEEIDDRISRVTMTFYHPAGTVSMGKVVDTDCRVKGVDGLRVVDASVLPVPIAAHYQVAVYALAEQIAVLISEEWKTKAS